MGTPGTRSILRRFRLPLLLLVAALAYGTIGYVVVEGWNVLDAVYMTVTTLTTVGFREVNPLDRAGEIFTISLLAVGLGAVFAAIATFTDLVVSGELQGTIRQRRTLRRIDRLSDHYIICAFGRVGRAVADELRANGEPFMVIETDEAVGARLERRGIPYLIGDPSDEDVLAQAGIHRARGLVCAVDSDAVNVFITLTARQIKPSLVIVARASDPRSRDRLERAGADRVVSPYDLSGRRMAALTLRPAVVDFVELVRGGEDMVLEEIQVRSGSVLDGVRLGEACARHEGVSALALKRGDAPLAPAPDLEQVLGPGDFVVVLGPTASVNRMAG
ncbi:MAG: potassium channel protein [Thermoleophilia bacterium]|jgi:voltage-gated potassium channel|nr:potassium channel protein [Thermoleophilia bacterium]